MQEEIIQARQKEVSGREKDKKTFPGYEQKVRSDYQQKRKDCKMKNKMKMLMKDQSGITALETAIILIAFVVVAAVFAFTILSAGTFSTEQSRAAIYAGLAEVQGSIELRGSVIAEGIADTRVTTASFTIANVAGGNPVDLTSPDPNDADGSGSCAGGLATSSNHYVVVYYRDSRQLHEDLCWAYAFVGENDGDELLEGGELAELTVPLTVLGTGSNALTETTSFAIELKPPHGSVLLIERTTPDHIDTINDLH